MAKQFIQKLNPRHHKILEYCLRGWTTGDIAKKLAMSGQQVSIVVHSPSFQFELSERRQKLNTIVDQRIVDTDDAITAEIKKGAREAVEKLREHVGALDPGISLRAACETLDRSGHPRVQRIESKNLSVIITAENAKLIEETMGMDKDA